MLSLEPATITNRSYPELFQTGETAYGKPLVDAQHPHNFIMALGVHYAHPLSEHAMLELYFAPVGDPALGPVAFPHRASADEDSASAALAPLAGFDAHRRRSGDGGDQVQRSAPGSQRILRH